MPVVGATSSSGDDEAVSAAGPATKSVASPSGAGVAAVPQRVVPGGRRWQLDAAALSGHPSWLACDERSVDRGAATVWVVGGLSVLMVVMTGVLWFGAAVVARHQAEGAADLAALAAAVVAVDGERQACAEARWVVERMGGVLRSCRLSGWDALVEVDVPFGPFGSAAGRARAGPVELNP